jgi:prephenate dehydratase
MDVPYAMVPLTNSSHGMVIETYDLLRSERVPRDYSITGDTIIDIEHCLFLSGSEGSAISQNYARIPLGPQQSTAITTTAREGGTLKNVDVVYSHEQAFGQCMGWLNRNLPNAKQVPVSSTAAAAKMLLNPHNHQITTPSTTDEVPKTQHSRAAIASEICLRLYPELQLVQKGIQDNKGTFTMRNNVRSHQASSLLIREPNTVHSDL